MGSYFGHIPMYDELHAQGHMSSYAHHPLLESHTKVCVLYYTTVHVSPKKKAQKFRRSLFF